MGGGLGKTFGGQNLNGGMGRVGRSERYARIISRQDKELSGSSVEGALRFWESL